MGLEHLKKRLDIAIEASKAAADCQRANYQKDFGINTKSSGIDLVTTVDLECDALIREILTRRSAEASLPEATLITEETFVEGSLIDMDYAWVVDPLDGTTNFAHGFPHFSVSIAFMEKGQPVVGVVYDTMKDELFTAIKGEGAFLNGNPLNVSRIDTLEKALLGTGFPYDVHVKPEDNMGYFLQFMKICHGVRRAGSAALDLVYLASARMDGFWELRLAPWDVAAGSLITEEAGGKISNLAGQPLDYGVRRINILGSNGTQIHRELVTVCKDSHVVNMAG